MVAPVVVEAYVNGQGEVYDYRIVSGPVDDKTRSQVENLLLWSHFEPARFFGQPVRGSGGAVVLGSFGSRIVSGSLSQTGPCAEAREGLSFARRSPSKLLCSLMLPAVSC